ncbi:MAG: PQQ-like beta-propeller repeat protein [Bryobacterales bacterium]|nr:PQQ-like beta-propeller repeat protein [Bryobacterales bacterium]
MNWLRSGWGVFLASVVVPPAGIVLQWLRPSGLFLKLAGTAVTLVWFAAVLVMTLGIRWELDGSGSNVVLSMGSREEHYDKLEQDRTVQQAEPPPVVEPPVTAAQPVAAKPDPEPAAAPPPRNYWTDFRGPNRDGRYEEMPILTRWPDLGLDAVWRHPVGGGYASFVVADGRAYTIEQRRRQEVAAAYDLKTGRELWISAWDAYFTESLGGPGPRATPTWHEGRLYVMGAEGEFRCLDAATGKLHWRRNVLSETNAGNLQWAMSAAPLIVDDKVIVHPGARGASVAAYKRLTGEPVWKALDDKAGYSSPMLATVAGRRQILLVTGERLLGMTVEEGRLLWEYPWRTQYDINASQPIVVGENRVFISSGYGHGAAVVELTPSGEAFTVREVWMNNRMKNKFTSSVLHEGHVYGLDEAILACIDVATGELKWKGGRYGYGQLVFASGHLIVTTETGDVVLVKATPEGHQEVARFPGVDGKTWNHPALAGGLLLVRNTTEMAAFRVAPN